MSTTAMPPLDHSENSYNCMMHANKMRELESRQSTLEGTLVEIKDLLGKIDVAISGDMPRGVAGAIYRLAKLEEDVLAIKRGNYVGSDMHNSLVTRVDAHTRVLEESQKILATHQVVITEYVNNKARKEGATWMAGKIGKWAWAFIGAGGLVVVVKILSLFGIK